MFSLYASQLYNYFHKMNKMDIKLELCHLRFQLKSNTTLVDRLSSATCGQLCVKEPTTLEKLHTESSHGSLMFIACSHFL